MARGSGPGTLFLVGLLVLGILAVATFTRVVLRQDPPGFVSGEIYGTETSAAGGVVRTVYLVILRSGETLKIPAGHRPGAEEMGDRICLRENAAGSAMTGSIVPGERCAPGG